MERIAALGCTEAGVEYERSAARYAGVFPRTAGILIHPLHALAMSALMVLRDPIVYDLVAIWIGCDALAMLMADALRVVTNTPTLPDGVIEEIRRLGSGRSRRRGSPTLIFAYRHGFDLAEGRIGPLVGSLLDLCRRMGRRTQGERQSESANQRTSRSDCTQIFSHYFSPITVRATSDRPAFRYMIRHSLDDSRFQPSL